MVGRRFAGARFQRLAAREYSYVNIAPRTLAANTFELQQLLIGTRTPDEQLISDATNVAQIKDNSLIKQMRLRMCLSPSAVLTDPLPVAVVAWKDGVNGLLADPTTAEYLFDKPDSAEEKQLKAYTWFYKKFYLTPSMDCYEIELNRLPRRMSLFKDTEVLKIAVHNLEAATDSLEYWIQGRFVTQPS